MGKARTKAMWWDVEGVQTRGEGYPFFALAFELGIANVELGRWVKGALLKPVVIKGTRRLDWLFSDHSVFDAMVIRALFGVGLNMAQVKQVFGLFGDTLWHQYQDPRCDRAVLNVGRDITLCVEFKHIRQEFEEMKPRLELHRTSNARASRTMRKVQSEQE